MVNGISTDYGTFTAQMKAKHGINLTSLGKGEANFADYGGALSENLKQRIIQSANDQAGDAALQSKIAGLFGGKSVLQSKQIISAARNAGIEVSVSYEKTTYISDNKADGHYDKDVRNGSIAVYTFVQRDAQGNEVASITIADANGNGALETEEIFMNEILSGVVSDITASGAGAMGGANGEDAALQAQLQMQAQLDAMMQQMEEQFRQTQQEIEEMMQKIQEEATAHLMADDKDNSGFLDGDEALEEEDAPDVKAKKEEELRNNISDIIDENYANLPSGKRDQVIDYVMRHITTATDLNILDILETIIGAEE